MCICSVHASKLYTKMYYTFINGAMAASPWRRRIMQIEFLIAFSLVVMREILGISSQKALLKLNIYSIFNFNAFWNTIDILVFVTLTTFVN